MEEHFLETLSHSLADRIASRKEMLVQVFLPPGERAPFTTLLSKPKALAWWRRHRFDSYGQGLLQNMAPEPILELDNALSQANEEVLFGIEGGIDVT